MYGFTGQLVCQDVFEGLVQTHPRNISRYVNEIEAAPTNELLDTDKNGSRSCIFHTPYVIAVAFVQRFMKTKGMSCSTGRGTEHESAVRLLPS